MSSYGVGFKVVTVEGFMALPRVMAWRRVVFPDPAGPITSVSKGAMLLPLLLCLDEVGAPRGAPRGYPRMCPDTYRKDNKAIITTKTRAETEMMESSLASICDRRRATGGGSREKRAAFI